MEIHLQPEGTITNLMVNRGLCGRYNLQMQIQKGQVFSNLCIDRYPYNVRQLITNVDFSFECRTPEHYPHTCTLCLVAIAEKLCDYMHGDATDVTR